MKGFKDPQGNFRPTESKNGVRMSRNQTAKTQGVRMKHDTEKCPKCGKTKHLTGYGMCQSCYASGGTNRREREPERTKFYGSDNGMAYFHGGKAYHVEIDESLPTVAVDERYQDKDNKWHTGKNIIFAQGEDAQKLIDDSGGAYVNKVMDYLDSAGALEG